MVAVQPNLYYKAYDYGSLAEAADKLILMAHDFNAKKLTAEQMASGYTYTPVAPVGQVYDALAGIFSGEDAVVDKSKVALQISFASAQWGVDSAGSVVNAKPYTPGYGQIYNRLIQDGTSIVFDPASQSPYATYYNESSDLDYIIWYEDARSVAAKMQLANMFGVSSFSYWRLGNLPDYKDEAGEAVYLDVFEALLSK
jgi:spore germination protein YaaH